MKKCGCINSPNCFWYIYGEFTTNKQRKSIATLLRNAYRLYFGCPLGNQRKGFTPHVEEQQKMEAEIENVSAELESLRLKQQDQDSILAEKRVALVEKASRERFLDTVLDHEERALQAFSEVLEEMKQIEIQEKNILECERKKQTVLKNAEADIMTLKNRESRKVALESEISSQEQYMHSIEEEGENLLKEFDNIQCSRVKDEQKCKLLQNKCSDGEVRIKEQEDKIINLHSTFQRLHDKMYEKVEEDSKYFNGLLKDMMS